MNSEVSVQRILPAIAASALDKRPFDGPSLRKLAICIAAAALALIMGRTAQAQATGLIYSGAEPEFNNCSSSDAGSAAIALSQIRLCTSPTQVFPQEDPIWAVASDSHTPGDEQWSWTLTTTYQPCCGGGGVDGPNYGQIIATPVSPKDVGCFNPNQSGCGDPISMGIGNKILSERDFVAPGSNPLRFVRTYNSTPVASAALSFAIAWMHTYAMAVYSISSTSASVSRADGKAFTFNLVGSTWTPDADVSDTLVQLKNGSIVTGWQYTNASDDSLETYDAYGNLSSIAYREGTGVTLTYATGASAPTFPAQLLTVTDYFGRTLTFNSTSSPLTMTDPNGEVYSYALGSGGQIASVTYPDSTVKTYLYNETAYTGSQYFPYALTGVMDENDSRYDSTWYGTGPLAIQTALAGSVSQYTLTNTLDGNGRIQSVSMQNALGAIEG